MSFCLPSPLSVCPPVFSVTSTSCFQAWFIFGLCIYRQQGYTQWVKAHRFLIVQEGQWHVCFLCISYSSLFITFCHFRRKQLLTMSEEKSRKILDGTLRIDKSQGEFVGRAGLTYQPDQVKQVCMNLNPFPHSDTFWCPWETSLLKTLWEKEKLLVTSNFSFSHSVFYLFG